MRRPLYLLVLIWALASCTRATGTGPGSVSSNPASEPAADLVISPGATPPPQQLTSGGVLRLASQPSPAQPWAELTSSDPAVLSCDSRQHSDGSVSGTC